MITPSSEPFLTDLDDPDMVVAALIAVDPCAMRLVKFRSALLTTHTAIHMGLVPFSTHSFVMTRIQEADETFDRWCHQTVWN